MAGKVEDMADRDLISQIVALRYGIRQLRHLTTGLAGLKLSNDMGGPGTSLPSILDHLIKYSGMLSSSCGLLLEAHQEAQRRELLQPENNHLMNVGMVDQALAVLGPGGTIQSAATSLPDRDQWVLIFNEFSHSKWHVARYIQGPDDPHFITVSGDNRKLDQVEFWAPLPPLPAGAEDDR